MKILFVSDTYYPHINGVYYFVCRVAPLLRERGHEVAVIAPSETIFFTQQKIDTIDVYGVPSLPVVFYPKVRIPVALMLKARIKRLMESFKPDLIHLQDHFIISKAVISVNKKMNIPLIGTNHFMPENLTALVKSPFWKQRLEKMLWTGFSSTFNQVLLVTTPTETGARLIRPRLQVPVMAVSSGIDLQTFSPFGNRKNVKDKYGIPDKPVLLFVGRLDPEKHIDEVLRAAARALKQADFCCVIVGKGISRPGLERLAGELGIASNVIFTGFVPDADLPYFYRFSRCFIIASTAELLSLGALQAMASGLPVIAVNAGALGELVHHNSNGFLFNTGDIDSMVHYIYEIMCNDELFRSMGERSIEFAEGHNIHNAVIAFERVYAQAAGIDIEPRRSDSRVRMLAATSSGE